MSRRPTHEGITLPPREARVLWWTTPAGGLAVVVPLSLLVALAFSDADYRFFYGTPRYLTAAEGLVFGAMAGLLALGALLPRALDRGNDIAVVDPPDSPRLRLFARAEILAFRMTVTGYVLLAAVGAARGARPSLIIDTVVSQSDDGTTLSTLFAPVAGITSLTQVGIAQVALAATLLAQRRDRDVLRRLIIVLLLAVVRTYVLTERLALIELAVPVLVVAANHRYRRRSRTTLLHAAPLLALPALLVFFGAFEYSRSWTFYRTRTTLSFPAFVVRRLAGYYATAYNNGAIELAHRAPGGIPYNSFQVLWTAPGIAQLNLYARLGGLGGPDFQTNLLTQYGNIEFNNPGGLAVPVVDLGVAGGAVFFLVSGLFIGLAYRSYRLNRSAGMLFYPVLFTGLLEIPRYVYWTEGRVFPALVFLGVTAYLADRQWPVSEGYECDTTADPDTTRRTPSHPFLVDPG